MNKVENLILASKTHCTEEHKCEGIYGRDDVHYFLDFDISILGSEPTGKLIELHIYQYFK